ncbi:MAG: xanthine dehydrogenase accessory protein XdhC [Stappia sp.]|uniref:xanthine dehydrogenase accessory protein XdhC n=1 Tax=Stappia sp. TaxID=1870903 RepID=UPI000C49D21C|nr:xanthine dehydrogenase accessory protein XdhC [Stappia sp.]MAA97626.1 xanthine dehydrogenase accessory protein XdhC [Stappia sp.]MBM22617.1 xanthine dehydrogenase accessory protein XdhC [Stappia sp.]
MSPAQVANPLARLAGLVATRGRAAMVSVLSLEGSGPREAGARLLVDPDGGFVGTIGGGALEHEAIRLAVAELARADGDRVVLHSRALGPELGQCCGGRVRLVMECVTRARLDEVVALGELCGDGRLVTRMAIDADGRPGPRVAISADEIDDGPSPPGLEGGVLTESFGELRDPLTIFGAGHVGRALVLALAPLPFRISLVDNRREMLAIRLPGNAVPHYLQDPSAALPACPQGSEILVMTHDHALDFAIADAALRLPAGLEVGMIGSDTKAARMRARLRGAGHGEAALARFRCPIGIAGVASKVPAAIATSVAAELLVRREARLASTRPVQRLRTA